VNPVTEHFTARAGHYDRSSRWCTDPALAQATRDAVAPEPGHRLLDVACGTGLVARHFRGTVAEVVGLDLTPAMFAQAAPHVDRLVAGDAARLPFADGTFDRVTCRQGLQFMDDAAVVREMRRVLAPGGRVVLVHLVAYGDEDRAAYFEILRLRNPARRNFYVREDFARLLRDAGFVDIALHDHVSEEDVEAWADNCAIGRPEVDAIAEVYRTASPAFHALHGVRMEGGRILDRMLFCVAVGHVPV
jgi:SAM-dependent methyltransferase